MAKLGANGRYYYNFSSILKYKRVEELNFKLFCEVSIFVLCSIYLRNFIRQKEDD